MADDGGSVSVRLSQEGGDEVLAVLKAINEGISGLTQAASGPTGAIGALVDALGGLGGTVALGSLGAIAGGIAQIGQVAVDAAEKIANFVEGFIDLHAQMEQFEIRLATIEEKSLGFGAALNVAQQNLIAMERMTSSFTTEALVTEFQRLQLSIGGTDAEVLKMVQTMSTFAQATGASMQVVERVWTMAARQGQFASGGRGGAMQVVQDQFKNILGPDAAAQIQQAMAQVTTDGGEAARALRDKLAASPEMQAFITDSWTDIFSALTRGMETFKDETGSIFDSLKPLFEDLRGVIQSPAVFAAFQQLTEVARQVLGVLVDLFQTVVSTFQSLATLVPGITSVADAATIILAPLKLWATLFIAVVAINQELINGLRILIGLMHGDVGPAFEKGADIAAKAVDRIGKIWSPSTPATGGSHTGSGTDQAKQIETAETALDKLFEKADKQYDLGGLVGLDKQLTQIDDSLQSELDQMDKAAEKVAQAKGWTIKTPQATDYASQADLEGALQMERAKATTAAEKNAAEVVAKARLAEELAVDAAISQARVAATSGDVAKEIGLEQTRAAAIMKADADIAAARAGGGEHAQEQIDAATSKKVAAEQVFQAKRLDMENAYVLKVLQDTDTIAAAQRKAAESGMTGEGLSFAQIDDAQIAAQEKAYSTLFKAWQDYQKNVAAGHGDDVNNTRAWSEALRVYYGVVSTSEDEAANKTALAQQKLSEEAAHAVVAYDVTALQAQGQNYEASLLTQNDKLLKDEQAFADKWGSLLQNMAKEQLSDDFFGVLDASQVTAQVNKIKDVFAELRTSTSANLDAMTAKMRDLLTTLVAAGAISPEVGDRIQALFDGMAKAQEATNAKLAQDNKLLTDQLTANWGAYYNDLLAKDKVANQGLTATFQQIQAAQKQVADTMYADAQTGADGYAAGLAKIMVSIKSFGQDVSDFMTTLWGQLTTTFDTAFYDVITGKFSDLKNVLKSLWDDVLKDFSKLLEQMLMKWLITGDAIGSGQGAGGFLGGLLGMANFGSSGGGAGASVVKPTGTRDAPFYVHVLNQPGQTEGAVSTPGGTTAMSPYEGGGDFTGPVNPDFVGPVQQGGTGGGAGASTGANVAGLAAIGYGVYQGVSAATQGNETSRPTYQGQDLGQTADFGWQGGPAMIAAATAVLGAAAAVTAAGVMTGMALTAAATATVPVIGWIAAAAILVVALIMTIFSGPQEGHVKIAMADAFDKSGASTVIGNFVKEVVGSTADFVGGLAARAGDNVAEYTNAYQKAFKDAYGRATFDIHAGSPDDLQKDVNAFFQTALPTLAMKAAFGQTGYGFGGNSNVAGGIAGISWNANNPAIMDQQGNWVKQQLYDPKAPIPMMLTGLGFTADAISAIASKLAGGEDIKTFQTYLANLVGVVADLGELSKEFGRTTTEWYAALKTAEDQQGTAASFGTSITNLKNQGAGLDTMSSEDAVTAAQGLVTASQTILQNMAQAMQAIMDMQKSITDTTASTVQTYENKLKTSAEIEADSRAAYTTDVAAIATAANPKDVQAAWQKVMSDLSTTLDAIVARINAIKTLQQSYADFRTQMATDAGPQFATDPTAWLTQNMTQIQAMQTALKTATGDDAVKDAQKLLTLVQQRYANEEQALANIKGMISSIDQTSQQSIQNLKMQAMGKVTTDAQGNQTWTPDTHAQGEYLDQQYKTLMDELKNAKTPDAVNSLMSQINSIISQLASQPQDPSHYAESRNILATMQQNAQDAADKLLNTMQDALTKDLKGIGDQLTAGETALSTALAAAQDDFTYNLGLMSDAATQANAALQNMADALTTVMNDLELTIAHWTFVMTNAAGAVDPNWDYTKNQPKATGGGGGGPPPEQDVWVDDPSDDTMQVCIAGPDKGQTRKKAAAPGPKGPSTPQAAPPTSGKTPSGTTPGVSTPAGTEADPVKVSVADFEKLRQDMVAATRTGATPADIAKLQADMAQLAKGTTAPAEIAKLQADINAATKAGASPKDIVKLQTDLENALAAQLAAPGGAGADAQDAKEKKLRDDMANLAASFDTTITDPTRGAVPAIQDFIKAVKEATTALNGTTTDSAPAAS